MTFIYFVVILAVVTLRYLTTNVVSILKNTLTEEENVNCSLNT